MPRVEGAGRKQFVEWTMVNKTENKYQVTCKYCNDKVSAKIERIRGHMSKCKKYKADSRARTSTDSDYVDENEIEIFNTQKRELPLENCDLPLPVNKVPNTNNDCNLPSGSVASAIDGRIHNKNK